MKGLLVVLSSILNMVLPTVIAVTGYLSFFHELDWLYPLVGFGGWILSVIVLTSCAKKEARMGVYYEGVGGAIGWVWMLSIPVTIWFLVSAIFLEGSWWEFVYAFVVGGFAKGTLRGFNNCLSEWHKERELEQSS